MKTTAEKSHTSAPQSKPQAPFVPGVGQPGFIPAAAIQAKLTVNTPGDDYEKEADATAEQVMRSDAAPGRRETPVIRKKKDVPAAVPAVEEEEMIQRQSKEEEETIQLQPEEEEETVQRQPEEEEETIQLQPEEEEETVQRQPEEEEETIQLQPEEEEETVQRQPEEEEEALQLQPEEEEKTVQRDESGSQNSRSAPAVVGRVLSSSGTSMEKSARTDMESRFGSDFSGVRIHTDSQAAASAKAISAKAYTFGNHIVFNSGQYAPHTDSGKKLLAHELTHVVQQGGEVRRSADSAAPAPTPPAAAASPRPATASTQRPSPTAAPRPAPPAAGAPAPGAQRDLPPGEVPAAEIPAAAPAEQTPVVIEPIMPEPPAELSPEAQQRLDQAQANTRRNAQNNADVPSDAESVQEARAGVTEPAEEADARASGALVETLGQRPEPSPEILELCENIRRIIREKRPPDEESLLSADPQEAAQEAGTQLNNNIEGDANRVGGEYDRMDENPSGTPSQIGQPIDAPPGQVGGPEINAAGAAPDAVPAEDVSLDADVEQTSAQMEAAGMNTEPAQLVQEGPIAEARGAHGELEQTAQEAPAVVLARQDEILNNARGDMEALQASALLALQQSRTQNISGSGAQQTQMVGTEEQMRTSLGEQAETIFTNAQNQVNQLLEPLTRTAMSMWEAGKDRISTEFRQHLDRVQAWVDERHSGIGGGLLSVWDDLTGLPGWVTDHYDAAERQFGDSVCELITEISVYVNGIILTCEQLIEDADTQIATLFANAPEDQRAWAEAEQERFRERLNGLRDRVSQTQQDFNRELTTQAAQAVDEVRQEVHALREAAKGLIGRIADAINEFLEDPIRFIINGLLSLVGIEPARFWALVARIQQVISDIANDPLGFAENLLSAIGAGFQRFFDNFLSHLFQGFIDWLFSGLGSVGVQIPQDLSLSSIITFFLQLMGITWERIRMLLARHIGEENVALIEQAYQLVSTLIEMGPRGIFEMLREQLDPQRILDQVINMAVEFVRDALITQISARILLMFNPVGAIVQAIEAIYRVLKWIFQNAARIFSLVETVVNGMADLIAGNISGMATAVEGALARLLVPVIDFFMEFAHLGDLPERVAGMIRGLQQWVEGILDRVIGWLANRARSVLAALGIGGDGEPTGEGELEDTEVGETLRFNAGGESHRLWIDESGGLSVKVASEPQELGQKIRTWTANIDSIPEEHRNEARSLLTQTSAQLQVTLTEAEQAKLAIQEAQSHPTEQTVGAAAEQDNQVESAEQQLANNLRRLFELFEAEQENEITENLQMEGEAHVLKIKVAEQAVTLSSAEEPLQAKLTAALAKLREYEGAPQAQTAGNAIRNMQTLLTRVFSALQRGTEVDRSQLREFSRETKTALEAYGSTFKVSDIVDGLPKYGPVVVGPHPVGNVSQPDGSTRESHHVPSKELAQALARDMTGTARALRAKRKPAARAAAQSLETQAAAIEANSEGTDLSAISLHRVTHQNAGGVAVHSAAMRAEIEAAIAQIDAENQSQTIRILNTASDDLAVNPSGDTLDHFVAVVRREILDAQATEAEKRRAAAVVAQVGANIAAKDQTAEQDGVESERQVLKRVALSSFSNSFIQGKAAVDLALRHSILDGPKQEREAEAAKLRQKADETWKAKGIIE